MSQNNRPQDRPPHQTPHVEVCMKHSPIHNNRIQWMLNRLRDTLIPQKYVARFFSMICTCDKGQNSRPIEDPWEDVQTRHLVDSVAFLENHISHNVGNLRASVIKEVLQHLRRQRVLPEEDLESRGIHMEKLWSECHKRSSVFRMLYLLQKIVEGNYSMLDPPRRNTDNSQPTVSDLSLTFELEGFNPDFVGNLIGSLGSNVLPIMKRYRCYIKIDKVPDGDGFKVKATIKKRAETIEVLDRIRPEVERWAKDTHELEESYEDFREEQIEKRKKTLQKLLRCTGQMSLTADWNNMLILLDGFSASKEIDRNVAYTTVKECFVSINTDANEAPGLQKKTLQELLRRTGKMSTTADWNEMLILLDGFSAYKEIDRSVDYSTVKEWFEEIRANWEELSKRDQTNTQQQTAVVSGELFSTHSSDDNSIGRLSIEETSVKSVITPQSSQARPELQPSSLPDAASSSNQSTIQPQALGPLSMQGQATSQPQASTAVVTTQQQSLSTQASAASAPASTQAPVSTQAPATTTQPLNSLSTPATSQCAEASSSGAATTMTGSSSDCTTLCLVHDRRWMATFQYFLTQCYTMINLPRKHGYPLSQHICTCGKPNQDHLDYFWLHATTSTTFREVTKWLKLWPEEARMILAPLVRQLEKYDKAETWHSLFKLVYYYDVLKKGDYSVLLPGAVLPGIRMRPSASSALPPVVTSAPAAVSSAPVTTAAATSSLSSAASAAPAPAPAPSPSSAPATGSSSGLGGGLPGCTCASCMARGYKRPTPPPSSSSSLGSASGSLASTAAAAAPIAPPPPKKKLRKLSPSDWIDDCYFHGKKKKFVFQCIVNYLHRYGRLPVRLNIPFSLAVCCCEENVEFKDFFASKAECKEFCRFMRDKLSGWRGDSKASVKPVIALLEDYIAHENVTSGFLKFVYYFKKAFTGDLIEFNQIKDELKKQQRNS